VNITVINTQNKCVNNQFPRYTHFIISCDPSTVHTVTKITEPGTCQYLFEINSKYGCPQSSSSGNSGGSGGGGGGGGEGGKLGAGWIFVIIFFVGFSAYFLIGAVVKWKVYGAAGTEMLPNSTFWVELPGLLRDGCLFVKNKLTGAVGYSAL